jgi:hypothetical protein
MKTAFYARIVFGVSAILLGIVLLLWHGSDLWQHLRWARMPFSAIVAWCFAIAQVAGGIGMMYARTSRSASIVLGAVYLLFSLALIPGMVATPAVPVLYVDFGEKFSLVCGAIAVYAATEANMARSAAFGQTARLGLGACTVSFAWAQVVYLQYTASLVPAWIPPNQLFWTIVTTIAFALAAIAILTNVQARLAMRLMALMLALFGVLVWIPHIIAHPGTLSNWNEIATNYLITGAVWLVADLRTVLWRAPLPI